MKELEYYQEMGAEILDACICVHRELGPGLLESVYEFALKKEFELRGIQVKTKYLLSYFIRALILKNIL